MLLPIALDTSSAALNTGKEPASSVTTIAAIFSGGQGMNVSPMRWAGSVRGIGAGSKGVWTR